jgi:hypothetical protein
VSEAPREVFLDACREVAAQLEPAGYRFAVSGPRCRRRSGDFTFQIAFQSSHYNAAGAHVALWVHATVFSPRIKKWRAAHPPLRPLDHVAGGQIGNLREPHDWLNWELADPSTRPAVIGEVVQLIREVALPYFARFEDVDTLVSYLTANDLPSMDIEHAIEFLLCFGDMASARAAAERFLAARPDLRENYQRALSRYAGGSEEHPSGYASKLAFASHVLGLGPLGLE